VRVEVEWKALVKISRTGAPSSVSVIQRQTRRPPDPAMNGMGARFMARMETQYRALSPTPDGFPALRAALGRLYAAEPNLTAAELGGIARSLSSKDGGAPRAGPLGGPEATRLTPAM
jgi:hypothetical protein